MASRAMFSVGVVLVSAGCLCAQTASPAPAAPVESGAFTLYKWQNPVGREEYQVTQAEGELAVSDSFAFVDRGTPVSLQTTLLLDTDRTPRRFTIKGKTSRQSNIDTDVEVLGDSVRIRVDTATRTVPMPSGAFTISGYAPMVLQQEMVRHWKAMGRPESMTTMPTGQVAISVRGIDTVTSDHGPVALTRYQVVGLKWGLETLWCDDQDRLIAASTNDAEFSRFEAIRAGYESALAVFVARSAADASKALAQLGAGAEPAGDFALVGATLIDGRGGPAVRNATVIVREGRIAGVGANLEPPAGMTTIDAHGKSVLPGLWDMHAHYEQVEWGPIYLASGVTTVRDVGNEFDFIPGVRDAIDQGRGVGPRLLLAGLIDGPEGIGVDKVARPEDAARMVQRFHAAGFRQIKFYSWLSLPVMRSAAAEAHRLGMTVTGHVPKGVTGYQGVEAGMDQINHINYVMGMMRASPPAGSPSTAGATIDVNSAQTRKAIQFLRDHHTVVDPTVALYELAWHPQSVPLASFEPGSTKLPAELAGPLAFPGVAPGEEAEGRRQLEEALAVIGALHRAGVAIVAGSDQGIPGHSVHRELELYVKAGFTPMEAIQAGTIVPARAMGLEHETGTLTVGKRADLIVVDGDPLEDFPALRRITLTVTAGRRYRPAPLWESVGFRP